MEKSPENLDFRNKVLEIMMDKNPTMITDVHERNKRVIKLTKNFQSIFSWRKEFVNVWANLNNCSTVAELFKNIIKKHKHAVRTKYNGIVI